jgi:2-phospho-L-lactate/phosphoenolpyruvate guanylyltransferase
VTTPQFTLLVPVKAARGAKTRLGDIGSAARADLMGAFARDAIRAARRTPLAEVVVVGDAAALGHVLEGIEVQVVADEGGGDLNAALRGAAGHLARTDRGVAVLLADLPCLRTSDLETVLSYAATHDRRTFVADAAGTGTTLLTAPAGTDLDPRFGPGSAAAHAASGAHSMTGPLASLRLDVDTTDDLGRALHLGVGPDTARVAGLLVQGSAD